ARGSADDVDDVPVRALEHWPEQAAKANAAEELEREAVLPRLLGKTEERARTRGACRVDQDVAAAMLLLDEAEHLLAPLLAPQVGRAHVGPYPRLGANRVGRRLEVRWRRCGEHDLRTFHRECRRDAAADAAAAAGDDHHLVREFVAHVRLLAG